MKLKICGMRDITNIQEVVKTSPDYLGFVFYSQSPRFVGEDFVMPQFKRSIDKVGVFVNATTQYILDKVQRFDFRFIQLHGSESVEQCAELKSHNLLIIKAFSLDIEFDFQLVKSYAQHIDFALFDTKGKYFGGNAKRFDWSILQRYDQSIPFFLSGGLSLENVHEVKELSSMNIHALDFNSGVESGPGVKNVDRIRRVQEMINSELP